MSAPKSFKFDTLSLHAGQQPDATTGARATPIYQTASFVFKDSDQAAAIFNIERPGHVYSRITNPTNAVLEERIVGFAALEVYSQKLAEIRSLAVEDSLQGTGIGRRLVQACVERGRQQNVLEVMAITSSDEFFKACGFDFTLPGEKKALFITPDRQTPS